MILTVDELRKFVNTEEEDAVLEAKLAALELSIRAYTNNNFQQRAVRRMADISQGTLVMASNPFKVGDTVQITESDFNDGLYTVTAMDDSTATIKEDSFDEDDVLVTRVVYPLDVKMGAVDIVKWKLKNDAANSGDKSQKDIQSETISRHSVTYATDTTELDIDEALGVPKKYTSFLMPYMKARFGQGVRL